MILAHCNLCLLGSSNSPASASWIAGTTGTHHHAQLIFFILVEMGFHHVAQADCELLSSGNPPTSASQSAGITGMSHHAQPGVFKVCLQNIAIGRISIERHNPLSRYGLGQSLNPSPRLEYSGVISAHFNLCLLGSSDSPASASLVAVTTGTRHHAQLIFVFLLELGFHHIGQVGLKLLTLRSSCLGLPKCWDYRREPRYLAPPLLVFLFGQQSHSLSFGVPIRLFWLLVPVAHTLFPGLCMTFSMCPQSPVLQCPE
ncbi:hypothetical protein AAY473_026749 [Plecturocebus cupreus]